MLPAEGEAYLPLLLLYIGTFTFTINTNPFG